MLEELRGQAGDGEVTAGSHYPHKAVGTQGGGDVTRTHQAEPHVSGVRVTEGLQLGAKFMEERVAGRGSSTIGSREKSTSLYLPS